jgi:hypothetical protein
MLRIGAHGRGQVNPDPSAFTGSPKGRHRVRLWIVPPRPLPKAETGPAVARVSAVEE